MNKEFSNRIYNLNFILIIMIVILHSSVIDYTTGNFSIFLKIINTICDMATPMFFTLSAYLFYRNFDISKYLEKLKKRVHSLVIPYFLWGIILYMFYYFIVKIPQVSGIFNNQFDFSLNALPLNILLATCAMTMWFVRCLIIFAICSPVIYLLLKKKIVGILVISIFLIINIIYDFGYSNPIFWCNIYMLGAFMAIHYKNKIENNSFLTSRIIKITIVTLFILLFMLVINYDEYSKIYYIFRSLSPIFIYLCFTHTARIFTKKIKYYNFAFWIFCAHLPIVQVIKKSLVLVLGNSSISIIICYFLTIVLSIISCILFGFVIKKMFPKLYCVLTGSR